MIRTAGLFGYALLAAAIVLLTLWATALSPRFPFLSRQTEAAWITAPSAVDTNAVLVDRADLRPLRFVRRFDWRPTSEGADAADASTLELRIRALTRATVWLNGRRVTSLTAEPGADTQATHWSWKRGVTLSAAGLVRGRNRLEVEVRNPSGPPLLELSATAPGLSLVTDSSWLVEAPHPRRGIRGTNEANAVVADDTRRAVSALAGENGLRETRARAGWLVALAAICGVASLALRRGQGGEVHSLLPRLCWGGVALFWVFLLVSKTGHLPAYWGYDGPDHLEYVRFIAQRAALPLATDGPAMYQPPLFYVLSAGLLWLFPAAGEGTVVLRLLPFLSGLTQVSVAYLLARRLFPGDTTIAGLAVLIAGLLPMNIYMSAFLSNEPLQAALSAVAILLMSDQLLRPEVSRSGIAVAGAVLGLALLTKVTPLLMLVPALLLLALRLWAVDRQPPGRWLTNLGIFIGSIALVCGWYYLRNWLLLGQPVIGNWDVPGARVTWWQHPGFHTADYFLGFGESLQRPFFAGFHSFWDGIHATLFSDSLLGGVQGVAQRLDVWNYGWMAVLPVLGLPAIAIGLAGVVGLARESLRASDPRRQLALGFAASLSIVYAFALFLINLRLPFYAQAKASYGLAVLAPLAVAGAFALASLHRTLDTPARRPLQLILHAWLGSLAIATLLAFGG